MSEQDLQTTVNTFTGELMTCVMCGRQERSDPCVESQWRCIVADGVRYYACPSEFPPDWSNAKKFEKAYTRILERIVATKNAAN